MSTAMKFPAEKNAPFTQFYGAKQTGPANTPFYRLHVLLKETDNAKKRG